MSSLTTLAGKYLTVAIADEAYGIPVHKVREIIRLQRITPVPQMPSHVRGVINLRGRVIPVIDLRTRFGVQATDTERTCVVVVCVSLAAGLVHMGLVVDAVEEVTHFSAADIEETPDFGSNLTASYLVGMAKVKGAVKTLLDIDRVLGDVGNVEAALSAA